MKAIEQLEYAANTLARNFRTTDRKSLLALWGVDPESEAESVRFHGRRVTKVGPKSNTLEKAAAGGLGPLNKGCERRTWALADVSGGGEGHERFGVVVGKRSSLEDCAGDRLSCLLPRIPRRRSQRRSLPATARCTSAHSQASSERRRQPKPCPPSHERQCPHPRHV